jgi:DNA repair protein RadD
MDKDALVADVVDTWLQRAEGRPTFCFAVNRVHANHLQQKFLAAGVQAGYVDAYTDKDERREVARQFHAGEIKVVCNVGVLTTGIDWDVRCIILARPTKSEMLFVQMIGRGLRTADGKNDCLIPTIIRDSDSSPTLATKRSTMASHAPRPKPKQWRSCLSRARSAPS